MQQSINLLLLWGTDITTPDRNHISYFVDYETLEDIIKETVWQSLVSQQLHYITVMVTGCKHWGNMFVKTEFILKYYSQEACRGNLLNVTHGCSGQDWVSKYNFFGFSPVNDHFICISPLLNVHNLFFQTNVRIGWNQEISIIGVLKNNVSSWTGV